jgi:SAM-dependent methyltransferase
MPPMTDEQERVTSSFQDMSEWLKSPLGSTLLKAEKNTLEGMINRRFGYHLLQMSCADIVIHEDSPIGHKICLTPTEHSTMSALVAKANTLPLASESIDMVLLHHVLDFSSDPHQLLREANRVLIAGGDLLIVGFNPFSTWGIRHKIGRRKQKSPWQASLLTSFRLCDWLKLLDFQIDQVHYGMYVMPINQLKLIKYSSLLGKFAQRLNWPTGAFYIISARKQRTPLMPIREPWKAIARPFGQTLVDNASMAPSNPHKLMLH